MILNLLTNAAKYAREGRVVELAWRPENGRVRFEVMDEGPGVDTADVPRLFTPFDRLGHAKVRGTEGTGLGLSVCRRIAQLHGGGISVKSLPGEGSRFTLHLPAAQAAHHLE